MIFSGLILAICTTAIQFDLLSLPEGGHASEKCFSLYLAKDVIVTGQYETNAQNPQFVNLEISDSMGSVLFSKKNSPANQLVKFSFTTHDFADVIMCFTNNLQGVAPNPAYKSWIKFSTKTGVEAEQAANNAAQIANSDDKLKPLEVDLKGLYGSIQSIVQEMEYLKEREVKMRDTNESTNDRVKWWSLFCIVVLVSSGCYQLYYLRSFFQSKKLL